MILCDCIISCGRETGSIPAKSRDILCTKKKVVPRHEATIPQAGWNWPEWESNAFLWFCGIVMFMATHLEPIEDEI